jgi:hypothetical protein
MNSQAAHLTGILGATALIGVFLRGRSNFGAHMRRSVALILIATLASILAFLTSE